MSTVTSFETLAREYQLEAELRARTIRGHFEDVLGKLEEFKKDAVEQPSGHIALLENLSPLREGVVCPKMVKTFTWAGVLLVALTAGYRLSRCLLGPIVNIFVGSFSAFVASFVVLPWIAFNYLSQPVEEDASSDRRYRHALVAFAVLEGLLMSALFWNRITLDWAPLPAFSAFAIAAVIHFGSSIIGNDHVKLLVGASVVGLWSHVIWVIVLGLGVSTFYVLLALLYTAAGVAVLQLYVSNVANDKIFTHVYQLSFVYSVMVVDLVVTLVFSEDKAAAIDRLNDRSEAAYVD